MDRNKIFLITLVGLLASCAGTQYQGPESFDEKMSRFEKRNRETNEIPRLSLSESALKGLAQTGGGRAPASAETPETRIETSNKKLYFMALYSQYEGLRSLTPTGSTREVNFCPSFHTGVVEYKERYQKRRSKLPSGILPFHYQAQKLGDESYISYYPELSLPLTEVHGGPTVASLLSTKDSNVASIEGARLLSQAYHRHVSRVYEEITELCETGTSSNYYNFENLLTHVRTKEKLLPSKHALEVLMRTSIITNLALIESLGAHTPENGRAPASGDLYTSEALKRLGAPWALEYMKNLVRTRH